jgi:hypothetical protein
LTASVDGVEAVINALNVELFITELSEFIAASSPPALDEPTDEPNASAVATVLTSVDCPT